MPRFRDLLTLTRSPSTGTHIGWDYLPHHFVHQITNGLDINPPFQREYVWKPEQKIRYVEFILSGGTTGKSIYLNCPGWSLGLRENYVLVDGEQRLETVLGFLNNEFPVFNNNFRKDFTDHIPMECCLYWHVNDLKTYEEVLRWYIELNTGGTIHTEEEIVRVRKMLLEKAVYEQISSEQLQAQSNLSRDVFQEALQEIKAEELRYEEHQKKMALEALNPKPKRGRKTK
jgi:uncharacterized protein YerC